MDLPSALYTLASYRTRNTRASQDTFAKGLVVLKSNGQNTLGDDGWAFLEQLALASIDVGRLDIADRCIKLLLDKFPDSPRVDCLQGIRLEASEPPELAFKYYEDLLNANESNGAVWKRKISVLRRMGKIDKATEELVQYLDTFYTDVEGWIELADIYSSVNQYTSSLQSLSHALLLAPQNPFYVLQAAETAYTASDLPLALKFFLTTVDMTDADDSPTPADSIPTGVTTRAWYGVKLCTQRLLRDPRAATSASQTSPPDTREQQLLDELATERLLTAYSTDRYGRAVQGRDALVKWLEMT